MQRYLQSVSISSWLRRESLAWKFLSSGLTIVGRGWSLGKVIRIAKPILRTTKSILRVSFRLSMLRWSSEMGLLRLFVLWLLTSTISWITGLRLLAWIVLHLGVISIVILGAVIVSWLTRLSVSVLLWTSRSVSYTHLTLPTKA